MKPNKTNIALARKAMAEVAELERSAGLKIRTSLRAGAEDGGGTCKPWMCARPLYGIPLPTEL